MPRNQNRSYKKGKPHRDARKFVIVAEGEREDDYFTCFEKVSKRVVVEIVPREGGKSAAKYLLERLAKYADEFGLEQDDLVWFVLDVDRWPRKEIDELQKNVEHEDNWSLAISNPCFEVWLYYHIVQTIPPEVNTGKRLKTGLSNLVPGGYNRVKFAKLIATATENASAADAHKQHYFPEKFNTKVYHLAQTLLDFLGNNWNP